MRNRVKSYINSEDIPTILSEVTFPSKTRLDLDSLFEGPKTFAELLREEIERAKRIGYKEAIEKLKKDIQKNLERYITQVAKTTYIVEKAVSKFLPGLKIIQCRANFYFSSTAINLFFVIDAAIEDEITFSNILNGIEQAMLKEDNFIVETYFINKRGKEIDYDSLKNEYPFLLSPSEDKK